MPDNKIIISKKNEVFLKIQCEPGIAKEFNQHFSFEVPGAKFSPAYKKRIWDGTIKLFSLNKNEIYLGLLYAIEEFCHDRNYEYEYDDTRPDLENEFSLYHAKKFIDNLNIHSNNKQIDVRNYQIDAFVHAMQRQRCLLLSPTASGKSLIIYLLFMQLSVQYQKMKGLIIVPTTSLVSQIFSDFQDYSSHNNFDVSENVHLIFEGRDKVSDKILYVSTWQSIYKMSKEYFHQFDYVIGDESHLFKAQSLKYIMENCINAKYRIGLTGTLDGTHTHQLVLEGLFGKVKKVITTKELIDNNQISDLQIKCLVLKHSDDVCFYMKNKSYQEEIEYLITCEARNKFIKNLAISLGNNTLILFNYVEKHGKTLYNEILNAEKIGNRKVFFVYGHTETIERENIRKIMETENDAIVVASYGTFSTGINIRNLHNIIFASPSKSRIRNLQSIGRGLRQSEGKQIATLYDIADDLRYKKEYNYTLKHFIERIKIYDEEKFNFKIYNIGLKNGNKNIQAK